MIRNVVTKYLAAMAMLLLSLSAHAQDRGSASQDPQRFSPERLTFTNEAGRSQYRLSTQYVLLQFNEEVPESQQRAVIEEDASFARFSDDMILPAPR